MQLDARQIIIGAALLSWGLAAIVEFQAIRVGRKSAWPQAMTIALIVHGLGLALFSQRGVLPGVLTVAAANVLLMLAFSFFYVAVENVRGESPSLLVAALPPAMIATMFPLIGFSDAMVVERVAVFTIVSFAAYAIVAISALGALARGRVLGPLLIAGSMLAMTVIHVVRASRMIDQSGGNLFANEAPQLAYHSCVFAAVAFCTFGYMDMARQPKAPALAESTA